MKPDRAFEIDWERCSKLELHDRRVIAVALGTADLDRVYGDRVFFIDAAKGMNSDEVEMPIELVRKVTTGNRGFTSFKRVMRELQLSTDDLLMLDGMDVKQYAAESGRVAAIEHPTMVATLARAERQMRSALVRQEVERVEAKRDALARKGSGLDPHALCAHPKTRKERSRCKRMEERAA